MSDETTDLQAQVTALQDQVGALERKVSALQAQLGVPQAPTAGGDVDADADAGDLSFPVSGPGG
jgi:hypothetical protein